MYSVWNRLVFGSCWVSRDVVSSFSIVCVGIMIVMKMVVIINEFVKLELVSIDC